MLFCKSKRNLNFLTENEQKSKNENISPYYDHFGYLCDLLIKVINSNKSSSQISIFFKPADMKSDSDIQHLIFNNIDIGQSFYYS